MTLTGEALETLAGVVQDYLDAGDRETLAADQKALARERILRIFRGTGTREADVAGYHVLITTMSQSRLNVKETLDRFGAEAVTPLVKVSTSIVVRVTRKPLGS